MKEHEKLFQSVKEMLRKTSILEKYEVSKNVVLNCDASEYGIGCVLSHIVEGKEKPISYKSRTMEEIKRNYPMTDKESL